jgi:type I restriction enzyme S subunit
MTLDIFFEKFDLFADAPDAVAKMRELVLNLAVQGSLVQPDAADEDVEHLLARNDATRSAAAKSDRRADAENQPLLSANDRWEIPQSWSWHALADLVLFVDYRGKTPAKLSNGIRLLTAKNVRKGEINLSPEEFLSEEEYHAWMTRGFPKAGDVLFTTEAPMGNAAVVELTDRFALAQRVICFQSYGAVDSSFLVLQILSTQFQFILDKNGTGVTAKGIKASKLKQLPIALPPLAEQKRIVAKVDELMALCDRLEAQQQERETRHAALARASLARFADAPTPANLPFLFHPSYAIPPADLRKSILTLAVQGKLVPQDPNDEPAEELIARIAQKRRAKKAKEYAPVDSDAVPFDAPYSWLWVRLGSLSLSSDSGWSPQCGSESRSGNEWGVLKVSAVSWGGFDPEANKALPSGMEARPECEVRPGDFLLSRANTEELVARSVVVEQTPPGLMMSDKIVRFTFPDEIEKAFVNLANLSDPSREYYMRNASGTSSSMKNIGREVMCNLPIALPPLAEQRRIVAKVEQLMALVDALETQLAASRASAANLLSALVAELTGTANLRNASVPTARPSFPLTASD